MLDRRLREDFRLGVLLGEDRCFSLFCGIKSIKSIKSLITGVVNIVNSNPPYNDYPTYNIAAFIAFSNIVQNHLITITFITPTCRILCAVGYSQRKTHYTLGIVYR